MRAEVPFGVGWWPDRREVLDALVRVPGLTDHAFACFLLEQEARFCKHTWGFSHGTEIAALLLAEHRRPEDVWTLWDAISTSFDTWGCLPHSLLLSAGGTSQTLAYVEASGHEHRESLLKHLQALPELTDEEVTALVADRRDHYATVHSKPGR